jgi:YidC/Oxa1 family membrane protein insertase
MLHQPHKNTSEDNRNLILALVLTGLVLFGWRFFTADERAVQQAMAQKLQNDSVIEKQLGVVEQGAAQNNQVTMPEVPKTREDALLNTQRVRINTPELHGSINLKGARFDDLTLASFNETTAENSKEVVLLTPRIKGQGYFAEFGWAGAGVALPNSESLWQADSMELNESKPITLRWNNGQGLHFEMRISVDAHYMFTITRRVVNDAGQVVTVAPYSLINRTLNEQAEHFIILHEGPLGVSDEVLNEYSYDDIAEAAITKKQRDGWVGITDKYWLTTLIPSQGDAEFTSKYHYYSTDSDKRYQTDILSDPVTVQQGAAHEDTTYFFAGAKKIDLLDSYEKTHNIVLFDRAVDFGVLYFLTRPFLTALTFFNSILGNFGLAILALTVVIKLLMFPLANKSYASMSQMKFLMPKMKEIRERFSDDRVKMNQEIMQLYKTEGVNPAAGCLPMLLQIPVFFALYKVLFIAIEMRHAPFYGWIEDLSVKDPSNIFTLFGTIPWSTPDFLHVGLLPLVMTATMIIQQKLNPKPADPTQAQVMQLMPYMFLFLFASFPAGLVLYWTWNNTLSIAQQYMITRRFSKLYDKETGKRLKPKRVKNKS